MSKQEVTNFRIFAKFVKAEVRKHGGRVEIPRSALAELIWRGWRYEYEGQTVVFTLKAPDKTRRDLNTFVDRSVYRLDLVLKYLVMTASGQRLAFTDADLVDDAERLLIDQHLDGLFALVTDQKIPSLSGGGQTITVGDTIAVAKDAETPPPTRKN